MPRKCCVYGCKSNYKSTKVGYSVFIFPRDETLRREWIRKIPNANFNPTKYTCVCEKHFTVEEVSRLHVIGDKHCLFCFVSVYSSPTVRNIGSILILSFPTSWST